MSVTRIATEAQLQNLGRLGYTSVTISASSWTSSSGSYTYSTTIDGLSGSDHVMAYPATGYGAAWIEGDISVSQNGDTLTFTSSAAVAVNAEIMYTTAGGLPSVTVPTPNTSNNGGYALMAVSSDPYVATLTTSSWTGSSVPYSYTITGATHGKGLYPQVDTWTLDSGNVYEQTYDSPSLDITTGNITVYTNAKVAMKVVIR